MDMQNNIVTELEKSGYDDFTKIRYIYKYVCNMFSYDIRFIYGRQDLKTEIYNKKIDLSNVEDFEITCYTCAHVLVDLLYLFGIKSEIVKETDGRFQHAYVVVKHKGKVLKLDPTIKHDITRVKMNSPTLDFQTLIDDPIFYEQLIDADKQIEKTATKNVDFSVFYNTNTIMQLIKVLEKSANGRKLTKKQAYFEKLEAIVCLINTRTDFYRYDDIDYYFSYLLKKFKMNEEKTYIKPAVFFKNDDESMKDLINIILVEYDEMDPTFYILEKNKNNFKIRKSDNEEILEKLDNYSNWNVDYYFRNKAEQKPKILF